MRKGFATLFRDIALVIMAVTALVGFTGRSDWPLLVVLLAAALCAIAFIVLRHHEPGEEKPGPSILEAEREGGQPDLAAARALLDALPDPVLVLDAQRGISLANLAARDLLGGDLEGGPLYVYVHTEALRKATTEEALALMTREAQRLTTWLAARPREGHAPPAPTAPPTTADGDISDADLDAFIEAATGFPVSQDPRHAEPVAEQRRRVREAFKTHARRPR